MMDTNVAARIVTIQLIVWAGLFSDRKRNSVGHRLKRYTAIAVSPWILALGCSGPAHRAASIAPSVTSTHAAEAVSIAAVPFEFPLVSVSGTHHSVCREGPAAAPSSYTSGLEFNPLPLHPLPYGPRIREMPRVGPKRTFLDLREDIARQTPHMNACYRWVRLRHRLGATTASVKLSIDPFGLVTEASVSGGDRELDDCIRDGLIAMRFSHRTPRITKATMQLAFEPSGQSTPSKPPPRPISAPDREVSQCMQLPTQVPVDDLVPAHGEVFATFDDWSWDQWEVDFRRQHHGMPPPRPMCVTFSYGPVSEDIERTILSNAGAYRQCYIEALRTNPGLSGELVVRSEIGNTGAFEKVHVAGLGGDGLAGCIGAAFHELQVQPIPSSAFVVQYTFTLIPDAPASIPIADPLRRGRAQLERLDAEGALESFVQAIRTSGGGADECWGRLGVVQAMLIKAPWVFDPRVWTATTEFIRYASDRTSSKAIAACLVAAGPIIASVATWPYLLIGESDIRHARIGRWRSGALSIGARDEALVRVEQLFQSAQQLPGRQLLLEFLASGNAQRRDVDKTIDALVPLFVESPDTERTRRLLETLVQTAQAKGASAPATLRPPMCPSNPVM
jgi:hypothetical protein